MPEALYPYLLRLLRRIDLFCRHASGVTLRSYQLAAAQAIVRSCLRGMGLSLVVLFPRQSGKNELQAQLQAYLLTLFSQSGAEMVSISPTFKPQTINAMRRLQRVLEANLITRTLWHRESGYIYRIGAAGVCFLSGAPEANIVGATASTLLSIDEAQDIGVEKYDRQIAPMAASTNATRVFWGTAWTSHTLLARELRAALVAQQQDGIRRVFRITADEVAAEVPAYGRFVEEQVRRFGRQHPVIKSQFFSEEIDAQGGMFPPDRRALMQGSHPPQPAPLPGHIYAFLIDVGGEDAAASSATPFREGMGEGGGHDSTALTIVEIDRSTLADPLVNAATYAVVHRQMWTGAAQTVQYGRLRALAELWQPRAIVIDATGIGAGLASFLAKALPGRVIPFTFNAASKSWLGWKFLAIVESGRFRDYRVGEDCPPAAPQRVLHDLFFTQLAYTACEVHSGVERRIQWGVPQGARNPADGALVHDDLVLSAALAAVLEDLLWNTGGGALIVPAVDPLEELSHGF